MAKACHSSPQSYERVENEPIYRCAWRRRVATNTLMAKDVHKPAYGRARRDRDGASGEVLKRPVAPVSLDSLLILFASGNDDRAPRTARL